MDTSGFYMLWTTDPSSTLSGEYGSTTFLPPCHIRVWGRFGSSSCIASAWAGGVCPKCLLSLQQLNHQLQVMVAVAG